MENGLFRKKSMETISSPEQLTDYLRVTTPGIWIILVSIILLLIGILAWSAVGTLETKAEAKVVVKNGQAEVVLLESNVGEIKSGMPVRVANNEYIISEVHKDDYGRTVAYADIPLSDGSYDAIVVTEQIHPIKFLLEGNK